MEMCYLGAPEFFELYRMHHRTQKNIQGKICCIYHSGGCPTKRDGILPTEFCINIQKLSDLAEGEMYANDNEYDGAPQLSGGKNKRRPVQCPR